MLSHYSPPTNSAINNNTKGNPSGTGSASFLGVPLEYWYFIAAVMIIAAGVMIYVYA